MHAFVSVLPIPKPRGSAESACCPYFTAQNVSLALQRRVLRALHKVMQMYVGCCVSLPHDRALEAATTLTAGLLLAVFDSVLRVLASDTPSAVSELLTRADPAELLLSKSKQPAASPTNASAAAASATAADHKSATASPIVAETKRETSAAENKPLAADSKEALATEPKEQKQSTRGYWCVCCVDCLFNRLLPQVPDRVVSR